MSLTHSWEDPALPPISSQVTISEGGELPPYQRRSAPPRNRISVLARPKRGRPKALPAPWDGPSTDDLMQNLPPERTWRERREGVIAEIRLEIRLGEDAYRRGDRMPGREILQGEALLRFIDRSRAALVLWERELAYGEPQDDAPRALEVMQCG